MHSADESWNEAVRVGLKKSTPSARAKWLCNFVLSSRPASLEERVAEHFGGVKELSQDFADALFSLVMRHLLKPGIDSTKVYRWALKMLGVVQVSEKKRQIVCRVLGGKLLRMNPEKDVEMYMRTLRAVVVHINQDFEHLSQAEELHEKLIALLEDPRYALVALTGVFLISENEGLVFMSLVFPGVPQDEFELWLQTQLYEWRKDKRLLELVFKEMVGIPLSSRYQRLLANQKYIGTFGDKSNPESNEGPEEGEGTATA